MSLGAWGDWMGWDEGLLMELDPSGHLDSQWARPRVQAPMVSKFFLICSFSFDFTTSLKLAELSLSLYLQG